MFPMHFDPERIIKYIVWYATQRGTRLTTIRVIKFMYLADLYYAREQHGQTMTGWPWAFIHYGPYCTKAYQALENAASKDLIAKRAYDSKFKDEFFLFSCDDEHEPSMVERLPVYVIGHLQRAIAKWGDDTAALLDHIYFETEPMFDAKKGEVLDFAKAKPIRRSKPVELKKLSRERVELARKHIKNLGKKLDTGTKRLQQENAQMKGLIDDVYFRALDYMDGEDLKPGLSGRARIIK